MPMSKVMKAIALVGAAAIVLAVPTFAGGPPITVPEPTSIMMLAGGIGAVAGLRYYILRKK
jgi:peptidoglycan/LPS O-acetylase OafA/YrhL